MQGETAPDQENKKEQRSSLDYFIKFLAAGFCPITLSIKSLLLNNSC